MQSQPDRDAKPEIVNKINHDIRSKEKVEVISVRKSKVSVEEKAKSYLEAIENNENLANPEKNLKAVNSVRASKVSIDKIVEKLESCGHDPHKVDENTSFVKQSPKTKEHLTDIIDKKTKESL